MWEQWASPPRWGGGFFGPNFALVVTGNDTKDGQVSSEWYWVVVNRSKTSGPLELFHSW